MSDERHSPPARAAVVDLVYIDDFSRGWRRRRRGRGFSYHTYRGRTITSTKTKQRLHDLAIPPAWEDVWICPRTNGHIQALGYDESERRQYIYHPRWHEISNATKFHRMRDFAAVLPKMRTRIREDLDRRPIDKRCLLAAAIRLIDRANLRIGNTAYTEAYGSHGVTTLLDDHVDVDGSRVQLDYPAKGRKQRSVAFSDAKVSRVLSRCEDIDGQFLFEYHDEGGAIERIESGDVNAYLRDIAGARVTAKDFRTWSGSVEALGYLLERCPSDGPQFKRKTIVAAIKHAAAELANTPAVARSSYVHPGIPEAAAAGTLCADLDALPRPTPEYNLREYEVAFAQLLPTLDQHLAVIGA